MTDTPPRPSQRFPKTLRLRKTPEFERVYRYRCSAADGLLVVYAAPNGLGFSRLGTVVSRKIGNAVVRNRWKRLIREAFRRNRDRLPPGLDLVVLPKRPPKGRSPLPTYAGLVDSLLRLAEKLRRRMENATPR